MTPTGAPAPVGEIVADSSHVLAFEGYVAGLDPRRVPLAMWLLEQHRRKGLAAFQNLNGAYALCVFDRCSGRLSAAACRFARRDLYYMREEPGAIFATDLDALLAIATVRPGLAANRVAANFLCGAVYGSETLVSGVCRALPGAFVHISERGLTEDVAAGMLASTELACREDEALEELDRRLRTAVERLTHVSARRVVLMSAGTDSTVAAACVKAVTGELDAITMRMPANELEGARAIAHALEGVHHACECAVDRIDVLAEISAFVQVMEEPTWLGLGMFTMTLARAARGVADGFVCGVSADALFADPAAHYGDPRPESIFHYVRRPFDAGCLRQVVHGGPHPDGVVPLLREVAGQEPGARFRLAIMLQTGLLVRYAARLARFHQAEALFPYLDQDVIEFVLRLPSALLRPEKRLLRKLAARYYGTHLQRPWKVGFYAHPIEMLMKAGRLGDLLDLLDERRTRERGVYRARGLRRLVDAYRRGQPAKKWHAILWQLVVFELFCRRFVDAAS